MLARLLGLGALIVTLASAQARADIMHWYWQVEVNGQAADTSRPIVVGAGDEVGIELWAEWEPRGDGFAWAVFGIQTSDEFFQVGEVSISRIDGNGLNTRLDGFGRNGEFADGDASGQFDTIDDVSPAQFPPFFNAEFDPSNPLQVYRIGWSIQAVEFSRIAINHSPTLDNEFGSAVFLDEFGTFAEYESLSRPLVFVPAPSVGIAFALMATCCACMRQAKR